MIIKLYFISSGTYLNVLSESSKCNWGQPKSRMLMTQLTSTRIQVYQNFLKTILKYFGPNGTNVDNFNIFQSNVVFNLTTQLQLLLGQSGDLAAPQPLYDLMFSDATVNFYFPTNQEAFQFFQFIGKICIHKCL